MRFPDFSQYAAHAASPRDARALANDGLALALVKRLAGRSVELEDLAQDGRLALLRAADTFDPARGVRFSTFATRWASGLMLRTIKRQYVYGRSLRDEGRARDEAEADSECATEEGTDAGARTRALLARLDPRSADVLARFYGFDGVAETATQIAARLGVTPARVGQIKQLALARLRHLVRAEESAPMRSYPKVRESAHRGACGNPPACTRRDGGV